MTRDFDTCEEFSASEQEMDEPETEDFLKEVVENSLKTKKKGYLGEKRGKSE